MSWTYFPDAPLWLWTQGVAVLFAFPVFLFVRRLGADFGFGRLRKAVFAGVATGGGFAVIVSASSWLSFGGIAAVAVGFTLVSLGLDLGADQSRF